MNDETEYIHAGEQPCPYCGGRVRSKADGNACPSCANAIPTKNDADIFRALIYGSEATIRDLETRIERLRHEGVPRIVLEGLREDIEWNRGRIVEWQAELKAVEAEEIMR
jgi:hypothetical protein